MPEPLVCLIQPLDGKAQGVRHFRMSDALEPLPGYR